MYSLLWFFILTINQDALNYYKNTCMLMNKYKDCTKQPARKVQKVSLIIL